MALLSPEHVISERLPIVYLLHEMVDSPHGPRQCLSERLIWVLIDSKSDEAFNEFFPAQKLWILAWVSTATYSFCITREVN